MTLSLDGVGSASGGGVTSLTLSLTTANPGDIIYLLTLRQNNGFTGAPSISSIVASGLTFNVRSGTGLTFGPTGYNAENVQSYYAVASSPFSGNITVNYSGSLVWGVVLAFGVSGANTTTPFDSNASLPVANNDSSGSVKDAAVSGVSTTNPNDFLILYYYSQISGVATTPAPGFTEIGSVGGTNPGAAACYQILTNTETGASFDWGSASNTTSALATFADALVAAPPPIPANPAKKPRPFQTETFNESYNWFQRHRNRFALPIVPASTQSLVYKSRQRLAETQDEYTDLLGILLPRQRRQGFVYGPPPAGTEYVTKLLGLAAIQPPSGQEVSKLLGLATAQPPSGETIAKLLGLATTSPPDFIALSKLLGLVVVEPLPGCGPIPVFPTLPVGFPVKWRPTFKTTIGVSSSGREVRYPSQQFAALHEIELTFEVLRDQTQNQTPYQPFVYPTGYTDYMQLCQLFLMMYGKMGLFYFDAPWDDSRTNQIIGLGDGSTTEFIAFRTFGTGSVGLTEPVGGINQIQNVQFSGVQQPTNSYSALGNIIAFNSPPPTGVTITATFTFYYLCHFIEDNQDFDEFLKDIWRVQSLKFRSVFDVFENYVTTAVGVASYNLAAG